MTLYNHLHTLIHIKRIQQQTDRPNYFTKEQQQRKKVRNFNVQQQQFQQNADSRFLKVLKYVLLQKKKKKKEKKSGSQKKQLDEILSLSK